MHSHRASQLKLIQALRIPLSMLLREVEKVCGLVVNSLVTSFQARSGARVTWGGIDIFTDELALKEVSKVKSGNAQFSRDVAVWTFQSHLCFVSIKRSITASILRNLLSNIPQTTCLCTAPTSQNPIQDKHMGTILWLERPPT